MTRMTRALTTRALTTWALAMAGAGLAVLALAAPPSEAAFIKRDFLMRSCAAHEGPGPADCTGYIVGVADTLQSAPDSGICVPESMPIRSLREAVAGYIRAHRDGPDTDAAPLVRAALRSLYPCTK